MQREPLTPLARFAALCAEAQACVRCATMAGRRRVLSEANGQPGALVCFVGEAPGRRGAERTAIRRSRAPTGSTAFSRSGRWR